jgi:hypothetical protein
MRLLYFDLERIMVQLFPAQILREQRFHNCLKYMHEQNLMRV